VPFHAGATLHPKIVKQIREAIEEPADKMVPPSVQ
jgi:hypothetical protein